MTPPPSAITTSPRSSLADRMPSTTSCRKPKLLVFSPAGSTMAAVAMPASSRLARNGAEMMRGDVLVGDDRGAHAGQARRDLAPARATRPGPIRMS